MEKKNILAIIFVLVGVLIIIGILLYNGYIIPTKLEAEKYEIRGVDVSEYQGEIDWKTLSSQDIDFAFIKATEGSSYKDPYFTKNYEQLNETNLLVGAYHFFSFDSSGEEQAKNYIETVGTVEEDKIILPIVDFEFYGDKEKNLPNKEDAQKELQELLNKMEKKYKIKPLIYATKKAYDIYIKDNFTDYDIWIRNILTEPSLEENRKWTFWQYTGRARLNGYDGKEKFIDLNVFNGSKEDFENYIESIKQEKKNKIIEEEQEKIKIEESKITSVYDVLVTNINGNVLTVETEERREFRTYYTSRFQSF